MLAHTLLEIGRQSGLEQDDGSKEILSEAAEQQRSLVGALLDSKKVDESLFLEGLATRLGLPWWNEATYTIPPQLREKLPVRMALRHHLLPVQMDEHGLWLLTYDPFNLAAKQQVAQALSDPICWIMASRRQILLGLRQSYGVGAETFQQILDGRAEEEIFDNLKQEINQLDQEDSEASVVKFVNQIIREALAERATDIHVEPQDDDLRIRYRIDGVLHEIPVPPQIRKLQASVISRLKIMSHLDIAERRLPQDGRINLELEGKPIDVRVATIPSVTGESISLRLLGQERFDFSRLDLAPEEGKKIASLLGSPNGIVLMTGPTGCGKSTTLYTFLSSLNVKERRIVTIEEPVEHKIPGVIQIAVKPEINLTFAAGLRSILRGDPNVIMVGEMRDFETAEIAIRAALTGHLVFSTLHTNDAVGGITRLIDMGVEPFLVGSAVRAFVAQRLVRLLCPHCKSPAEYPDEDLAAVRFPVEYGKHVCKANGCEACRRTGYQGRAAIFEICLVSARLQDLITQRKPASQILETAIREGMVPLRQDGWRKVIQGLTTIEEVLRVTATDAAIMDG
jgi:general secretion pathway protein E